ncbi:hypothetical protein DL98DRAFT_192060 [Cadophora sp. DSE1049]|nr:hypothetical protein DL98DRAFT_192060 [Cadophora sp. DSE1049]
MCQRKGVCVTLKNKYYELAREIQYPFLYLHFHLLNSFVNMNWMSDWLLDISNSVCSVPANPDIGGLLIRVTFVTLPLIDILFLLYLSIHKVIHNRRRTIFIPSRPTLVISSALKEANTYQLAIGIAYLLMTLTETDDVDFFHLRFLLDISMFCALSKNVSHTINMIVAIQSRPRPLWSHITIWIEYLLSLVFAILFIITGILYRSKINGTLASHPNCYDRRFKTRSFDIFVAFSILGVWTCLIPYSIICYCRYRHIWVLVLGFLTPALIILLGVFSFLDYSAVKKIFTESEAEWSIGQAAPLLYRLLRLRVRCGRTIGCKVGDISRLKWPI